MNQGCKTVSIMLTRAEAKHGCQKDIFCDGMDSPISVTLQPGIQKEHTLYLEDVPFVDDQGCIRHVRLAVNVRVRKRMWIGAIIAAVIVQTILTAIVAGVLIQTVFSSRNSFYDGPALDPAEVFPNYEMRYYLSQMDPEHQQAAALLYTAAMNFETECRLPQGIDKDEFTKIGLLLRAECPELMQIDLLCDLGYHCDGKTGDVYKATFTYSCNADDYEDMLLACQDRIENILDATEDMTDWEIEKYIFDELAMDITYDLDTTQSWNAWGALVDGKAKCDGISSAMKWCLEEAGIQALCILGDPKEGDVGHAWNMVRLDGVYYNLDLTADVRHIENIGTEFENEIFYFQYNVSDLWTTKDYIVNSAFTDLVEKPVCDNDDSSYFAVLDRYILEQENYSVEYDRYMKYSRDTRKPVIFQVEDDNEFQLLIDRLNSEDLDFLAIPGMGSIFIQCKYSILGYNVIWVHITWVDL